MSLFGPSGSPSIAVREIDLTGVAPNVDTSISAMVGDFKWGPVDQPTRIANEGQLATVFGTPSATKAVDFLSAAQFLKYSSNLIILRAIEDTDTPGQDSALNAVSGLEKTVVKNDDVYDAIKSTFSDGSSGKWIAKYPGDLGNSLSVSVFAVTDGDSAGSGISTKFNLWDYRSEFDGPVGTSEWAENNGIDIVNDEIHVAVIDEDGLVSGTKGSVLEAFPYLSLAKGAKTSDGSSNFMPEVVNRSSSYIWFGGMDSDAGTYWGDEPTVSVDYATGYTWSNSIATESLSGGVDSLTLTESAYITGFDQFEDPEQIDVQILIAPGLSTVTSHVAVVNDLVSTAKGIRKDCVVVASPNRSAVVNNPSAVEDTITTTDQFTYSNYLIVDNNYFKLYDKYNDQYVYVPAASSTAGLLAATDANFGPWYSPAGSRRGLYLNVVSLAYSPLKADRDTLYKAGVNPIVQLPGQGTLLYGDKTKESRPSAFDRINVRRLFLAIEKSIALAARSVLFEFNDEFTRAEFVGIIEPVLREIQARRGIQDYYVQCDETNNTAAVIDRNELIASIYVKPARSINYITLNFVAVRTGVSFDEIVGNV